MRMIKLNNTRILVVSNGKTIILGSLCLVTFYLLKEHVLNPHYIPDINHKMMSLCFEYIVFIIYLMLLLFGVFSSSGFLVCGQDIIAILYFIPLKNNTS